MSGSRSCVIFFIIFVQFQIILSKPFLGDFFCDLLCDDDDVSTVSSSTTDSDYDFCSGCSTTPVNNALRNIIIKLPSNNGLDLNITRINGNENFILDAVGTGVPTGAPTLATAPPVVTPPAGATTVAPTTAK